YGGQRFTGFDDAAVEALEAYAWPGNVRELQNVVERGCALADGDRGTRRDLPGYLLHGGRAVRGPAGASSCGAAPPPSRDRPLKGGALPLKDAKEQWMRALEGSYLRGLLERHDGNVSAAAKAAGIDRKTFHRLINKYRIRD